MKYFAFISRAILGLGACASTPQPTIDRVQRVPVYVTIPDDILMKCPLAPNLTDEEMLEIQTETDYNEKFVFPLWEAHDKCKSIINNIIIINEDAKRRNTERKENGKQ